MQYVYIVAIQYRLTILQELDIILCMNNYMYAHVYVHCSNKLTREGARANKPITCTNTHTIRCMCIQQYELHVRIQWNLSNPDTVGTEESDLISEVS